MYENINNKSKKAALPLGLKIFLIIVIIGTFAVSCKMLVHGIKYASLDHNAIAKEHGFEYEKIDSAHFTLYKDGVTYYFFKGKYKTSFYKAETERNDGLITVSTQAFGWIEVCVKYTSDIDNMNGTYSVAFTSRSDFSEDSLNHNNGVGLLGKQEKYYSFITNNYISQDELVELYENASEMVEAYN